MYHLVLLFVPVASSFLFHSGANVDQCYELDLENCFREAFLAAMHPPVRRRKELGLFNFNLTAADKKRDNRNFFLCHDVRRFSMCFLYPGCSDQTAAAVASVQYHMVFGKKLPMHVFLAYRGFGKQMCEQACSRDTVFICRRTMSKEEQDEEQESLVEMANLSSHISPEKDNIGTCERFRTALTKVLRSRVHNCGDAARCTCEDSGADRSAAACGINCEQMLQAETRAHLNASPSFRGIMTIIALLMCLNV